MHSMPGRLSVCLRDYDNQAKVHRDKARGEHILSNTNPALRGDNNASLKMESSGL